MYTAIQYTIMKGTLPNLKQLTHLKQGKASQLYTYMNM